MRLTERLAQGADVGHRFLVRLQRGRVWLNTVEY